MAALTRAAILAAQDLPTTPVQVPEWGGVVLVRPLLGSERDAFEAAVRADGIGKARAAMMDNLRAWLVATCAVDDKGARLFTDADIAALGKKNAAPLDRVFQVAQKLSFLSDKDVEDLTKNFAAVPSGVTSLHSA